MSVDVKEHTTTEEGDPTRVPSAYVIESSNGDINNTIDFLTVSPVVHQVFGGRKLTSRGGNRFMKGSVLTKGSLMQRPTKEAKQSSRSPRIQQTHKELNERAQQRINPTPAAHVGRLQVPPSLKVQHFGNDLENDTIEQVANNGPKKGATIVGKMIDQFYGNERKMVNNMYKGSLLSTSVLTDMSRYHKLKTSTGVEDPMIDEMWLEAQRKIEEEKNGYGLSLDYVSTKIPMIPKDHNEGGKSLPITP